MILLIDNYDSFVHNLARYFERLGQPTQIVRNDEIDAAGVQELMPAAIVLSPGPCTPREAGASLDIVRSLHAEIPMLGVCLGHQVIAEALGGRIVRAPMPVHGHASCIRHDGSGLFSGVSSPLAVGRYHSLVVDPSNLPPNLRPTAWTEDKVLMAFEHSKWPVFGVQFHPESILTESGYELLANFLQLAGLAIVTQPKRLARDELVEPPRAERPPLPARPVTF
jgi:anthranilate synthase/aminodeoxychorismate synthase-like glutamine amidotransferase